MNTCWVTLVTVLLAEPLPSAARSYDSHKQAALLQTSLQQSKVHPHAPDQMPERVLSFWNWYLKRNGMFGFMLQPVETPTNSTNGTLSEGAVASGVSFNAEGDLAVFMSALIINSATVVVCIFVFMILRRRYELIYSNNVRMDFAPTTPPKNADGTYTYMGWYTASRQVTIEAAVESIGLDNALLLEFCHLCMKILAVIGFPMLLIMGPLHYLFGGNAAGDDRMSYLSMGNVVNGSWLYYLHAVIVCVVCFVAKTFIFNAMTYFQHLRVQWLLSLPEPRSKTILVENIPEQWQSDERLQEFFEQIFGKGKVSQARTVKQTKDLQDMRMNLQSLERNLKEAQVNWEKLGKEPYARPTVYNSSAGDRIDAIEFYTEHIRLLKVKIEEARSQVKLAARAQGGINCENGFVTFTERKHKEMALGLEISEKSELWNISDPPPACDLLWNDLQASSTMAIVFNLLAYAAVAGLVAAYMPIVVGLTQVAESVDLGPLQPMWEAFAPTFGLTFMMSFLPTFLLLIFRIFYTLKADAIAQHKLQVWYFWFQILFVILVTAIGGSIIQFAQDIAADPFSLFSIMASSMPHATHFYMNFIVLQWATHAMILTRYVPLGKFLASKMVYDEEDARRMAEPEDQDYYGIGSRSARFTINMLIGIIFGTLSPPLGILVFINFALCRLFYGYLIPYAETKKPDLGGVFFVKQLEQLFVGLIIYCIMMIGVLTERAPTWTPVIIAIPSFLYVLRSLLRFKIAFAWERLPFDELTSAETEGLLASKQGSKKASEDSDSTPYEQPELLESSV